MRKFVGTAVLVLLASGSARGQSCDADLASCEQDLAATEQSLQSCVVDLVEALPRAELYWVCAQAFGSVTRDTDQDGVPDRVDQCTDTDEGLAVDLAGCSLRQFCERSPATRDRERRTCRRLDWQNDEPDASSPRDCRARDALCGPAVEEPLAGRACQTVLLTVSTAYAGPAAGVSTQVRYPADVVEMPGFGSEAELHVTNVSGVGGLFGAADADTDSDGQDETVIATLINIAEPILAGPYVTIRFACLPEGRAPRASDFACNSDVSNYEGETVPSSCSVALATDP